MYPNPQSVLPVPQHPDLAQYRKRAKELAKACREGSDAVNIWAAEWVAALLERPAEAGEASRRAAEREARQIADYARDRLMPADCALSQAQFVIARAHGFASWPTLVHHIEALSASESDLLAFERAADAIVRGDLDTLERLLTTHRALARARSDREHRATLLHYVSANGVEHYRQKTPPDIESIARRLIEAGSDIDAEADVYGGAWTTLALVVTSAHPRIAGVQLALADLLLEHGARMDARIVRHCLMNGCPEAAAHMAARGASLDLEEATGIGRFDLVTRYFEPHRTASHEEATLALFMAAWYDQQQIMTYLLDHGVEVGVRHPKDGDTALHVAAYLGNAALVELLLRRGAPINVRDDVYKTPPIVWALHGWLVEHKHPAEAYKAVIRSLAEAGAEVKPEWIDDERLRVDPELYGSLRRRADSA